MADIPESTTRIYVRFSDDGQHIRKWSREPFEEGEPVDAAPPAMDREAVGLVAGPIWAEQEDDCFTAEIQTVGGDYVVVTVHGTTRDEAERRQLAILSTLSADAIRQGERVSDADLKDAVTELLSHRGERPYRILRGGSALWETWVPSFRAAIRYLPTTPASHASDGGKAA